MTRLLLILSLFVNSHTKAAKLDTATFAAGAFGAPRLSFNNYEGLKR